MSLRGVFKGAVAAALLSQVELEVGNEIAEPAAGQGSQPEANKQTRFHVPVFTLDLFQYW